MAFLLPITDDKQPPIDRDREKRRQQSRNRRHRVKGCTLCESIGDGMGPSHDANLRCESGWYEHCTCDTCF